MAHRIYCDLPLVLGNIVELPEQATTHVARVLRLRLGSEILLFNERDGEFAAKLVTVERREVQAKLTAAVPNNAESPLELTLVQAIGKGERMDWAIQKAVELGITAIQPLLSERTVVQLKGDRADKRQRHWQQVVISACEQCGRVVIPPVAEPISLAGWCQSQQAGWVMDPTAEQSVNEIIQPTTAAAIVVGPEGGFTDSELAALSKSGIQRLRFGPRILRTETAGLALLANLQTRFGDCQ